MEKKARKEEKKLRKKEAGQAEPTENPAVRAEDGKVV